MPDLAAIPLRPVPPPLPGAMSQTALLVEDSRHAAEAIRLLARRLGWRLRRAETLAAARDHLRLYRPDVALIDLGLPDGSGLTLIAELAAARLRPARVVAISAEAEGGPAALAAGASAFVAKPLRLPADLPVLFGPGTGAAPALPPPDPLALHDDLTRAERALAEARLDYAARFVQGVARCAGDAGLGGVAERARRTGRAEDLQAALAARTRRGTTGLL